MRKAEEMERKIVVAQDFPAVFIKDHSRED